MTTSCYEPNLKVSSVNTILGDPRRVNGFNTVLARYAADHDGVTVIDAHGYLCPHGRYRALLHGHTIRFDGVHFSPDGAIEVWKWLAPQLLALARPGR